MAEMPLPHAEVFTSPPYLCVEVMSPEVMSPEVMSPDAGWATAVAGIMRTADGRIAMPLADVLLP